MDSTWHQRLMEFDFVLLKLGDTTVTTFSLAALLGSLLFLSYLSRLVERWIVVKALRRSRLDAGSRQTLGRLSRYVLLLIGLAAILQNTGIKLGAFGVLAGALGVGIGFGLQNIVSNFISGLIVMIERPVKVGDRIEVGGFEGDVLEIGARSTTLTTARRAKVIVPNQKFITELVRNWDAENDRTSLQLSVRTVAASDPRQIRELLFEVARENPNVEREPAPTVDMLGMDAAGFSFQLQVWTIGDAESRARTTSALNFALFDKLRERDIRLV